VVTLADEHVFVAFHRFFHNGTSIMVDHTARPKAPTHRRMERNAGLFLSLALVSGCVEPQRKLEDAASFSDEEIQQLGQEVNLENWDDGGELSRFAFLSVPQIFETAVIARGGEVAALDFELEDAIPSYQVALEEGGQSTFDDYVDAGALDGIVIVHEGKIVYERYPRMRREDQHILFSVSKVMVSTLIAILEDRGLVDVTEPVETYLPSLESTAWKGITVLDVLDMVIADESIPLRPPPSPHRL